MAQTSMSTFNRDRYRKKLTNLLARADDEAFFRMVWAVDALQSARVDAAKPLLQFPAEAATTEIDSKFAVHKFELETLINQLLVTPKLQLREGRNQVTDCRQFGACAQGVNVLRKLENAESGIYLKRFNIFTEMHRIGYRQFPWQFGLFNVAQLYRYAHIYGGEKCGAYFQETYGLSIQRFSLVGFGLHAMLLSNSASSSRLSMEEIGVTNDERDAAPRLLAIPALRARETASSMMREADAKSKAPLPTAYQPSFLRRFPIVTFGENGERLRAPLPLLIMVRATAGIYYDLVGAPPRLRNEPCDRFEQFCANYIAAMMPRFAVSRSYRYQSRGNLVDAPDILIKDARVDRIVIECKATKLTFPAQFAEDPVSEASRVYEEIAKGVFQLWRYFSHVRRGVIANEHVDQDARGSVLTLDNWLVMSLEVEEQIFANANTLTDEEGEIEVDDRRGVVFCAISHLESTLSKATDDSLSRAIVAAGEDRFRGWMFPAVYDEVVGGEPRERKKFPFDIGDVLPWWKAWEKNARDVYSGCALSIAQHAKAGQHSVYLEAFDSHHRRSPCARNHRYPNGSSATGAAASRISRSSSWLKSGRSLCTPSKVGRTSAGLSARLWKVKSVSPRQS
jgi:hypothetical protein